ncbi:MAG: NUDIX hydrolase [Paracoccus sp. (in: a-proteobacteria)]|nr:NUDIX hydrolase [Paracoccus sp. (in: a-proteobacteria)]
MNPLAVPVGRHDGQSVLGVKLVLTCAGRLLTCMRDDFAHIPWPAHWDLPGGGPEAGETAADCALRELAEEFGLSLTRERLLNETRFRHPCAGAGEGVSVFFTGHLSAEEVGAIRFGNEGQFWALMPAEVYIRHPRAVPHFRPRVAICLGSGVTETSSGAPGHQLSHRQAESFPL